MADVEAQVAGQIQKVTGIIDSALASSSSFLAGLQNMGGMIPPFMGINPTQYSPPTITIDEVAPESPNLSGAVGALTGSGQAENFTPGTITAPGDYINADLLANLPSIDTLDPQEDYSSALLSELQTQLLSDVAGGTTGLNASVELAMWERQSERDAQIFSDARDRLMSAWAAQGFALPDNTAAALITDLVTKEANQRTDRSREITTESFKLAVENRKFAITQAIVLESALMQYFMTMADRAVKFLIARTDLAVKVFLGTIEGYKANAEAKLADVRLQVETERGKIDAYIAQLNKNKAIAEIAALKLDALVKKYGVDVEAYRARIGRGEAIARVTVEQQRMIAQQYLEMFQAQLQAGKQNIETFVQTASIKERALTGGAQVLSNYIASAINALNAVVQLGYVKQDTTE